MTKTSRYLVPAIIATGLFIAMLLALIVSQSAKVVDASVAQGSDYNSTSTAASNVYGAQTLSTLLKTGYGSIGSIVITGANTGVINIYNATTTDITKRASTKATSTILIASIPASAAAGTYVLDVAFSDGLYINLATGNMPTSTITYR